MPPLGEVPKGKWFCDKCKAKGYDTSDARSRSGGKGKGGQDGVGVRGSKVAASKSAAAAAPVVATRASPRAAAAAAAAAAGNRDVASTGGKGRPRSPEKRSASSDLNLAAEARAGGGQAKTADVRDGGASPPGSGHNGKHVSAAAHSTGAADASSAGPSGSPNLRSGRPGRSTAATKAAQSGTDSTVEPASPQPDLAESRPTSTASRTGRPLNVETRRTSRTPPIGGRVGKGSRCTRGGSAPPSAGERHDSPVRTRGGGRPAVTSQVERSRSAGRGVGEQGGGGSDDILTRSIATGGSGRGRNGKGGAFVHEGTTPNEAQAHTQPASVPPATGSNPAEDSRRKKKRVVVVTAGEPAMATIVTAEVASKPETDVSAQAAVLRVSRSPLMVGSSSPKRSSPAAVGEILDSGDAATSLEPHTPAGDGTDPAASVSERPTERRKQQSQDLGEIEVTVTDENDGGEDDGSPRPRDAETTSLSSTPRLSMSVPPPAKRVVEPKTRRSHHRKIHPPPEEEELVDGRKFKRRRESAPAAMATPDTRAFAGSRVGDANNDGDGDDDSNDRAAGGERGSARQARVTISSSGPARAKEGVVRGRGRTRSRGTRPLGCGLPQATVENEYSRPRLHHRAPLVPASPGGRSRGVSGSGDPPVRRSKRKVSTSISFISVFFFGVGVWG